MKNYTIECVKDMLNNGYSISADILPLELMEQLNADKLATEEDIDIEMLMDCINSSAELQTFMQSSTSEIISCAGNNLELFTGLNYYSDKNKNAKYWIGKNRLGLVLTIIRDLAFR